MKLIVVDWGTTRLRAYKVEDGLITDKISADQGISKIERGQHVAVLQNLLQSWLEHYQNWPFYFIGMAGSREGLKEVPYVRAPLSIKTLHENMMPVDIGKNIKAFIVPGVQLKKDDHTFEVMRGEETLGFGAHIEDGLVVSAGTHPKWITFKQGALNHFTTFITGELYATLSRHSMVGRLIKEPFDESGFEEGLKLSEAHQHGMLLHNIFAIRAAVVTNNMLPQKVGPMLTGLLIGEELREAFAEKDIPSQVTLIADQPLQAYYKKAFERKNIIASVCEPEKALVQGLMRLIAF